MFCLYVHTYRIVHYRITAFDMSSLCVLTLVLCQQTLKQFKYFHVNHYINAMQMGTFRYIFKIHYTQMKARVTRLVQ
jgi:hypothetical protein